MGTHPIFESDFDCLTDHVANTRPRRKDGGRVVGVDVWSDCRADYEGHGTLRRSNNQLDKMGYNIGVRLVEDFLAKSRNPRCKTMEETAEVLREAFRQYLNMSPQVTNWNTERDAFSLLLDNNPLTDFVELPSELAALNYCQMICGIIRGALEMVQLEVTAKVEKDSLKGAGSTEIRICFIKKLADAMPVGED